MQNMGLFIMFSPFSDGNIILQSAFILLPLDGSIKAKLRPLNARWFGIPLNVSEAPHQHTNRVKVCRDRVVVVAAGTV